MSISLELVSLFHVRSRCPLPGIMGASSPLDGVSLQVRPKETVLGSRPFIVELLEHRRTHRRRKNAGKDRKESEERDGAAHRLPRLASSRATRPGCRPRSRFHPHPPPGHPHRTPTCLEGGWSPPQTIETPNPLTSSSPLLNCPRCVPPPLSQHHDPPSRSSHLPNLPIFILRTGCCDTTPPKGRRQQAPRTSSHLNDPTPS